MFNECASGPNMFILDVCAELLSSGISPLFDYRGDNIHINISILKGLNPQMWRARLAPHRLASLIITTPRHPQKRMQDGAVPGAYTAFVGSTHTKLKYV